MVDFLMMFSLCICVLSGVTLLIVHIWSKKKQKKEEAEDKTGGTVFHSGTRNVPKPIKERAGILQVLAPDGANTMPVSYMTLDDNGIELYYAGLYIDKLPVEGRFAHSFAGIFNMDYVESTVIIDPLLEESQKRSTSDPVTGYGTVRGTGQKQAQNFGWKDCGCRAVGQTDRL